MRCPCCNSITDLVPISEEQLKAFSEKVKADSSLQEKLKAVATPDGQLAIDDAISIAKEAGFEISASDLAVKQDLSEEQLEAVTGGGWSSNKIMATVGFVGLCVLTVGGLSAYDIASGCPSLTR